MKNYDEVYKAAIEKYGEGAQLDQTIEELCELIVAIQHYKRGKADRDAVLDEIADASIMIGQLRQIFKVSTEELKEVQTNKVILLLAKIAEKDSEGL
jgi:NTP pyrophosphatase (non-canonical NTP hydrolase)